MRRGIRLRICRRVVFLRRRIFVCNIPIAKLTRKRVADYGPLADPEFPTPEASQNAPRGALGPRQVRGAMFTWVMPEGREPHPEVLAVSEDAMMTLGLKPEEGKREDFKHLMAGNFLVKGIMPWATVYGGMRVPSKGWMKGLIL